MELRLVRGFEVSDCLIPYPLTSKTYGSVCRHSPTRAVIGWTTLPGCNIRGKATGPSITNHYTSNDIHFEKFVQILRIGKGAKSTTTSQRICENELSIIYLVH